MSGRILYVGAGVSDLVGAVTDAIDTGGKRPTGDFFFTHNGQPAQGLEDGTDITAYDIAAADSATNLAAIVTAALATDLQPSGQFVAQGNLLYVPLHANSGQITDYDIVSGSTFSELDAAIAASGKTQFGTVLTGNGLLYAQVITGTPAGGGGGDESDVCFNEGDSITVTSPDGLSVTSPASIEPGTDPGTYVAQLPSFSNLGSIGSGVSFYKAATNPTTDPSNIWHYGAGEFADAGYLGVRMAADWMLVQSGMQIVVGANLYTFTVANNVFTAINVGPAP